MEMLTRGALWCEPTNRIVSFEQVVSQKVGALLAPPLQEVIENEKRVIPSKMKKLVAFMVICVSTNLDRLIDYIWPLCQRLQSYYVPFGQKPDIARQRSDDF